MTAEGAQKQSSRLSVEHSTGSCNRARHTVAKNADGYRFPSASCLMNGSRQRATPTPSWVLACLLSHLTPCMNLTKVTGNS